MRIGIFGSYNFDSVGDHAILVGMLTQFRRYFPDSEFVVFAASPESVEGTLDIGKHVQVVRGMLGLSGAKKAGRGRGVQKSISYKIERLVERVSDRLPGFVGRWLYSCYQKIFVIIYDVFVLTRIHFWCQVKREMASFQLFIIGGGNLVMDMFPRWPIYPLMYVFFAKWQRVPVMFYAVGAGPLTSLRGRLYFRLACALSDGLTFRDQDSLELVVEKLGVRSSKMRLAADPALCLRVEQGRNVVAESLPIKIAMTVVSFYREGYWPSPNNAIYQHYCRTMADVIEHVLKSFNIQLTVFATNVQDILAAKDIVRLLEPTARVRVIERRLSVDEILSLLSNSYLLIGTRLHSLILAAVAGTPALAFSYQPKVTAFYQRMKMEKYVVPLHPERIEEIAPDHVLSLLEDLLHNRETITQRMRQALEQLREDAHVSIEMVNSMVKR